MFKELNPFTFKAEDKFLSHGYPTAIASGQVNFQLPVQTRVDITGDPLTRVKVSHIHKVSFSVTTQHPYTVNNP